MRFARWIVALPLMARVAAHHLQSRRLPRDGQDRHVESGRLLPHLVRRLRHSRITVSWHDGGEGHEELGGADVDDVTNLISLAKTLPYVGTSNVFMYGLSRGGLMTFLALKHGTHVNAAAVVGAVYDLEAFATRAPGIVASAASLIKDYPRRGAAALRERSAMNWPDSINVPLLILHGANDDEVPASEALEFAARLPGLKKTYQLIVYADDIHEAANNRLDRDVRIVEWFERYRR